MIMLNKADLEKLMGGQKVTLPSPRRLADKGESFELIPIKSSRTGRVVRMMVRSIKPSGEKGDVG